MSSKTNQFWVSPCCGCPRDSKKRNILDFRFSIKGFLKFEIPCVVAISFLSGLGYLPSSLSYVIDIINMVLLLVSFPKLPASFQNCRGVAWAILLFCIFCLTSAIINLVSPVLVLWEAMCLWRLFVYFCLAMIYWEWHDFEHLMDVLLKLQIINALFVLVEFFILGCSQDTLGGLFGVEPGCNAGLNVYMCVILAWCMRRYIAKQTKTVTLATTMIACLVIASIAEIKTFYIEFLIIVLSQVYWCLVRCFQLSLRFLRMLIAS